MIKPQNGHDYQPDPGSFRDPAGFVFYRDGEVFRQVNHEFRSHYDKLILSGLYECLTRDNLLLSHEELPADNGDRRAFRWLKPQRIPFVSYPYEWTFAMLKDAALTTLECQRRALEHGMSLKDASAYNVQFIGCRPIFIDSLSFELLDESRPWVGYRQFCRHFLAPLALLALTDARLGRALRVHLDGIPLDLAVRLLPMRAWWRLPLLLHLRGHAWSQKRYGDHRRSPDGVRGMSRRRHLALVDHLRTAVESLRCQQSGSVWGDYYDEFDYAPVAFNQKRREVRRAISEIRPAVVWDLGANSGLFSRLATAQGSYTIAMDNDSEVVDACYRGARREDENLLLPLVMDMTNPSPGVGWHAAERYSLLARGPADLVLVLALVHHIAIGNNVPFGRLTDFMADAGRWALVEFVPKSDRQVQRLLQSRQDVFADYNRSHFEVELGRRFQIERRVELADSQRSLYLLKRK